MATRKGSPEELPLQIKVFTLDEISRAISKLSRRIEEAKVLKTDAVSYLDQRREIVEHNIRDTIW